MSKYDFGGLDRHPANILRLISELEGSYQLCKWMGFEEDMKILDEMKKPYYKLYFKTKKSTIILCSSAVEPSTVNRLVAGSNPAGGVGRITQR